jgi:hypothetical protein
MLDIKSLPTELQLKIFFYSLEHVTAKIMKELIKETDEINNCHFNINTLKYEKLSFYNYLIVNGYLKGHYYFEDLIELLNF